MTKTRMNVKLLRKIQKHILEEPKRFLMGDICQTKDASYSGKVYDESAMSAHEFEFAPCGTAACIAGWALILSGKTPKQVNRLHNPLKTAGSLLAIPPEARGSLFLSDYWPDNYREQFESLRTPLARARIAVRRIDHFIKTKGAE